MKTTVLLSILTTGCNHLFYHPDNRIYSDPQEWAVKFSQYQVTTPDNEQLEVWQLDPLTAPPKATIVHFHGNAQNRTSHIFFSSWLAQHQYRLIIFDYRGYGGSTGQANREGLVLDGVSILNHIKSLDQHPIFIFGQSLGGAVAYSSVGKLLNHSRIKALILESTFGSYRRIARRKLASFWLTWPFQYPLSFLITDNESPEDYLAHIQIPILMIHGDQDPVIPIEEGKEFFNKLPNSNKNWWEITGGQHTPTFGSEKSPYRRKLLNYLESHL